jgi:molybdate transport system substrate-binding protein
MHTFRRCFAVFVLFTLVFSVHAQTSQTLTIFAAASLADAFEDIATAFKAENPNVDIVFNFGSSSTLATQLVEGAPSDIFASANPRQLAVAREGKRVVGYAPIFARNRLVLIMPSDNPANISTLADLANTGVRFVVANTGVPVRDYTDTMLARLAEDPAYGTAYRDAVIANIASEEDNVRQVVAKVALGEADAGVVYFSDVTPDIAEQVSLIAIPDEVNTIATYPIAITDDTANFDLAQAFIDFVLSPYGQAILVKWNFIPVNGSDMP